MTHDTPLDRAHAAMQDAPDDTALRLAFFDRLAASELYLMLKAEPGADAETVEPEIFDLDAGSYVLVFDREERLSAFTGRITPFCALSGRAIAQMLAGQNIGLGVNLDVAASAIMLPPEAVAWLGDTLSRVPDRSEARIRELTPPGGLPERLITALDARLATAMGLAQMAYLVTAQYDDGTRGHLLAVIDAVPQAEDALTQAVSEALTFSGIEAGALDIAFFRSDAPITARLARVGLRFDLPQLQEIVTSTPKAPGRDPDKPPKLK